MQYSHGRKIDQGQRVIACARDEGEAILRIERDAMRLFKARQRIPADDLQLRRINSSQIILSMHRDQDAIGRWIVHSVACTSTELDSLDQFEMKVLVSITASVLPRSSETNTRFGPGAYARPSG